MCGITGIICNECSTESVLMASCRMMTDRLAHRGPDDSGVWVEADSGIALGHRRLSILDLSTTGRQPMISHSGRYIITFNGEIYNYRLIRTELENISGDLGFKGTSDTEVMLAAIEQWGLKAAVNKFVGMFAFGLWDRLEHLLYLVRDRIGIKPLYYGWAGESFIFGSELKALIAHPKFDRHLAPDSVALYFKNMYIPSPHSIYRDAYKLEPGHILTLRASELTQGRSACLKNESYWTASEAYLNGLANPWNGTEADAVDELENILKESINLRMISDVPIGAFLSGGIDSSTVVSIMQSLRPTPVKTFSIGFEEIDFNEAHNARDVASYLGTDHTELTLTNKQLIQIIPDLAHIYDEPFADSSQIPTILVSRLARESVKVALSGDGGDELFLGYPRYRHISFFWKCIQKIPLEMRNHFSRGMTKVPGAMRNGIAFAANAVFKRNGLRDLYNPATWNCLASYLTSVSLKDLYDRVTANDKASNPLLRCLQLNKLSEDLDFSLMKLDDLQFLSYSDLTKYLPDDILVKVDRASMSVGLEARVPLLDHRLVEFAARLPCSMKIRNRLLKWPLRLVLYRHVPKQIVERQKKGFAVPLGIWFRGPLKDWVNDVISSNTQGWDDYLDPNIVQIILKEHLSGKQNWDYLLWSVLMFQSWLDNQSDAKKKCVN